MPAIPGATQDRTLQILEDLEVVRENLLALSDDIWLSIDHNDTQAMDQGVQFKRAYNEKSRAFDNVAAELSALIQQYTSVPLESEERSGEGDRERNERIVQELNREEAHSIDENFKFRRPHGFILDGQATMGVKTWRRVFELVCRQLLRRNADRFRALPDNPSFITRRGGRRFSRNSEEMRSATEIGEGIFAEINLDANDLCRTLRLVLAAFDIPAADIRIFLREDRDAAVNREGA
jgi:hypothetical protein